MKTKITDIIQKALTATGLACLITGYAWGLIYCSKTGPITTQPTLERAQEIDYGVKIRTIPFYLAGTSALIAGSKEVETYKKRESI